MESIGYIFSPQMKATVYIYFRPKWRLLFTYHEPFDPEICPGLNGNEIEIAYEKHQKVSSLHGKKSPNHSQFCQIWSNMKTSNNPAKYGVLIKQYLRSIRDMSAFDQGIQLKLWLFLIGCIVSYCVIKVNIHIYIFANDRALFGYTSFKSVSFFSHLSFISITI